MAFFKAGRSRNSIPDSDVDYDYTDSFSGYINNAGKPITSTELASAFFASAPKMARKLMILRDAVVKLAGLKTSGDNVNRARQLQNFRCEPGDRIGLFKVFSKTDNEVILGRMTGI